MTCFKYFIIKVYKRVMRFLTINIEDPTTINIENQTIIFYHAPFSITLKHDNGVYRYTNDFMNFSLIVWFEKLTEKKYVFIT